MKKSKIVSLVLAFAMLASMAVPTMAAEAEVMPISAPVTEGHWSDAAMGRWANVGVFKGDQYGDFMPAKEMTRAEFAQVLVNLMGYTAVAENTYADIPAGAWYADAMLKLVAAGVMQGTGYNEVGATVSPDAPISREQTAVLLCRALSLKPSADAKIDFPDAANVSDWAKDAVAALTERGMLNGTGDGNVSPALVIDRGSVAQMISNMVSEYVTEDGAVITGEQKGIVIVAAQNVTFDNAKLAETVVVAPKAARTNVTLTNGTTAAEVVVSAEGASVTVGKTAKAESVVLDANKSAITVNGTVENVTVNATANNADVTANSGAKIGTVATAAAGTDIKGAKNTIGTIVAEATATGTKVAASGAKIDNKSTETVGKVAPGSTGKAPSSGSAATDSGSSSSGSSVTGTYKITTDVDATMATVAVFETPIETEVKVDAGTTISATVTAKDGYKVTQVYLVNKDVEVTPTISTDGKTGTLIFTMPAADVVISAGVEKSTEPEKRPAGTFVFEAKDLTAFAAGAKADGDTEKAGTDDFFTLHYSAKTKVDSSTTGNFVDGYQSTQRVNFGGKVDVSGKKNFVEFTTEYPASVKIWFVQSGDDNRQMVIYDTDGNKVVGSNTTMTKNSPYVFTLTLKNAGTYYLGGTPNNNYIFKVEVTEKGEESEKTYNVVTNAVTDFVYTIGSDTKTYAIAKDTNVTKVTVTASPATAKADEKVTITVTVTGSDAYTLEKVEADGAAVTVSGGKGTFTMPAKDVTIKKITLHRAK